MAYKNSDNLEHGLGEQSNILELKITGKTLDLPHESYIRDADITRDGVDLVLDGPDGQIIVDGYFSAADTPALTAPGGAVLSPELVNSFVKSGTQYTESTGNLNDISPIGTVQEISGEATITRLDGSSSPLSIGSDIHQGDIIETAKGGAVNIEFSDESSFAVSEDTRLAIDEYVFDPSTEGGVQNFSVLKGVFVYTSGLIGREDPDDVAIETPVGSIGIRGTIIAGDVNQGEITVVEGAIVLRDSFGGEMTLASQFETGKFGGESGIQNLGQMQANEVVQKFSVISKVAPTLFSSIQDSAAENVTPDAPQDTPQDASKSTDTPAEQGPQDNATPEQRDFDADGATDQNGDNQVDGTVDEAAGGNADQTATEGKTGEAVVESAPENAQPQMMANNPAMGMIAQTMGMQNAMSMGMNMGTNTNMMQAADRMQFMMEAQKQAQDMKQDLINDDTGDDLVDPDILNNIAVAPDIPRATVSRLAPDAFFTSGENNNWFYHFDLEFDGAVDRFVLSDNTINTIENLETNGLINPWDVNTDFNSTNGLLNLSFTGDFASKIANGSDFTFNIKIAALNTENEINQGGFQDYTFKLFNNDNNADGIINAGADTLDGNNIVANNATGDSSLFVASSAASDGNTILLGEGNDLITLGNGSLATDNFVNLGNGTNTVNITLGSIDNVIVGGFGQDTYNTDDAQNTFFGMDGDDKIFIDLTDTTLMSQLSSAGNSDILIDAGHSDFRALEVLETGVQSNTGRGDTLYFQNNGNIDFTTIDDAYLKNIERIDLSGGNATVTLSYKDVIAMTDDSNTLLFRAETNDTLNFDSSFSGFRKVKDDIAIDEDNDDATAATGDEQNFDVYTDDTVTLIVEDNGAAVTGI